MEISYKPVTESLWPQLEALFGKSGACGCCWCMWFRLTHAEFEANKGERNRKAFHEIVHSGETPGILAFESDRAIGWVSVAPREVFGRLNRSRIFKPVDDQPVWSIVCLFVAKGYRRQGISKGLIQAAVDYAGSQGSTVVEAYAVEPHKEKIPDVFAYHGLARTYLDCGFKEVARRSETRPIMRYMI